MRRALLLLAFVGGCAGDGDHKERVHQSAVGDTLFVVNDPPAADAPPLFRLERDLVIGVAEGEEPYMLNPIESVAADRNGRIIVGSQWERDVRVFEPDGRFAFTIGGAGSGPGEFSSNYFGFFGITAQGDLITIEDLPRLQVYDENGTYIRSFDSGFLTSRLRVPGSPLGRFHWFRNQGRLAGEWRDSGPDRATVLRPFITDEDLTQVDWLDRVSEPSGFYRTGDTSGFSLPFTADFHLAITGEASVVWGISDAYRLRRYDLDTASWTVFSLEVAPDPVTAEDIAAFKEQFLSRPRTESFRPYLERAPYPDQKPFFEGLLGDDGGRVWVDRTMASGWGTQPDVYRYDIFDAGGAYLGRVEHTAPILHVRAGFAYARGQEEHPTVERYRLVPRNPEAP